MNPHPNPYDSRIKESTLKLFYATAAWVLSDALLAFGPKFFWNRAVPFTLAAFGVCILAGVWVIFAHVHLLRSQDELMKKVLLESMAITLGVVVTVGVPYSMLQTYELVPQKGDIAMLMVLVSITYVTSIVVGMRRYR